MQERPNMFNRTSQMFEDEVKRLFQDLFNIMLDEYSTDKDYIEKNIDFEKRIMLHDSFRLDLLSEKSLSYCVENRGKGYTFNDDGIILKDTTEDDNLTLIEEVFVNFCQYILYAQNCNRFVSKLVSKNTDNRISEEIIRSTNTDINTNLMRFYTFSEMYTHLQVMSSALKAAEFSCSRDCNNPEDYVKLLLSNYTLPQLNRFVFYVESLCDLINLSRHYPEIFVEKVGNILASMYSDDFTKYAFKIRDIAEKLRSSKYSEMKSTEDKTRTRGKKDGKEE